MAGRGQEFGVGRTGFGSMNNTGSFGRGRIIQNSMNTSFSGSSFGVGRGYATGDGNRNNNPVQACDKNSSRGGYSSSKGGVQPPGKYQDGLGPTGFDWPISKSKSYSTSASNNNPVTELGSAFQNVGFNSYTPPQQSTGFNAPAESRGFGSQPGRGFGSGGTCFGFNSCQGGFGGDSGGTSSEKRSFGTGFKSTQKSNSKRGIGLMEASQLTDMPVIIKDFYIEDSEITKMTDDGIAAVRMALNNITVTDVNGSRKPAKPVTTFHQAFRSYSEILEQVEKQGFEAPTPIQCQMWPIALSGHDVIGIAQTGTGKTLGFLLPILIHLSSQPGTRSGPGCVVLTPTRELAKQIHAEVKKYHYKELKSACLYGGASRQHQVQACQDGVDIIIACPGRLMDLVDDDVVDLSTVTFAVLDEADRMLDMGFEPDINRIMSDIRSDRQTILTSATWPESVRQMASKYTKDPFLIYVGNVDLSAVHTVTQQVFVVSDEEKREFLLGFLLDMKSSEKVIIFVSKKITVDRLAGELGNAGLKCQRIHGDRDQVDRDQAISDLKKGHVKILVGTDVVSRGLDIADITHVFNYDFPQSVEEYVHRIGRTGRAGKSGVAISLMTRGDWHNSTKLMKILAEANQEVPEGLIRMSERYEAKKLELGASAVDPRPRRRREERSERKTGFFDPYTGEPF